MNVVIPMAGKSTAFKEVGIDTPKPFIDIKGKTMVQRAYESINIDGDYYFMVLKEHEEKYNAYDIISSFCPDARIIFIDEVTSGPAETLYKSKGHLKNNGPLIQTNVDQVLEWDSSRFINFLKEKDPDGAVVTINTCDPHYSFIKLNHQHVGMLMSEKECISNNGLIGTHYWKSADLFYDSFVGADKKGYRYPQGDDNAEIYVSLTYNDLIDRGYIIHDFKLKQSEKQHVVGDLPSLKQYEDKL
tara:strand:- start:2606 stop:3337 length:732 start_codon:yes stop_codon:yes gene_type:complete